MAQYEKYLWEILVPTVSNHGKPFRTKQHKIWDKFVRQVTDGLTIMSPNIKGEWISDDQIFTDRMIPVRIYCTHEEIREIAKYTKEFYEQEAIMYYCISTNIYIYK